MKKLLPIAVVLVLVVVLVFVIFGGNKQNVPDENNGVVSGDINKETENNNIFDDGKITVDKVRNASETSADNFTTETVDGGISLDRYNGNSEIVVIPDEIDGMPVVEIGEMCFANNKEIKGVKVCDNVTVVEENAFANCINLEIFISGKNVKTVENYSFINCQSLEYVELNEGMKSLGMTCFGATDSLEEVYMPASITELDSPFLESETNVTILCESGSAAETYAKENGIKYEIK